MNKFIKNFFIMLIVINLVFWLIYLGYSFYSYNELLFLDKFKRISVIIQAFIYYCRNFTVIQLISILLSFNLLYSHKTSSKKIRIIFLFVFIAFTLISMLCTEYLLPQLYQARELRIETTLITKEIKENIKEAEDQDDTGTLYRELRRYVSINPEDQEAVNRIRALENDIESQEEAEDLEFEMNMVVSDSYTDLLDRIDFLIETGDRISAQYFVKEGLLFYTQDTELLERRNILDNLTEQVNPSLYEKKERARLLLAGNDSVGAYYYIKQLLESYPLDVELQQYYATVFEVVRKEAFFSEEIENLVNYPGDTDIVFIQKEDKVSRFVHFGKVIKTAEGIYFSQIDILGFSEESGLIYRYSWPYGKLIGSSVNLLCLDVDEESRCIIPSGYGLANPPESLVLKKDIDAILLLKYGKNNFENANISQLYQAISVFEDYGYYSLSLKTELIKRILFPFSFFLSCFLALAIGVLLEGDKRPLKNPLCLFVIVPIFPIVYLYVYLLSYFLKIYIGFFLVSLSLPLVITVVFIVQFIITFFTFLFFLRET